MGADASAYIGRVVVLRNDHGKNLQYTGSAFFHHSNQGGWEQWTIEAAVRDGAKVTHVYLNNAAHDIRLSASDNKKHLTASKNRDRWERWQLISGGDRFFLQSYHGTYLNQGADGNLLQSNSKGGSEMWAITAVGGTAPPPTPAPAPSHTHHHHHHHPPAPTPAPAPYYPPAPAPAPAPYYPTPAPAPYYPTPAPAPAPYYPTPAPAPAPYYPPAPAPAPYYPPAPAPAPYVPVPVPVPVHTGISAGRYIITDGHGRNLTVSDARALGQTTNRGGWEIFNVSDAGHGKFIIGSHHGTNLQCSDRGVVAVHSNRGGWEQWSINPAGGGKYYIVGHTGNHLGVDDRAGFYCKNRNTGGWEQWTFTRA